MPACTFFGHRECPERIKPVLYDTIRDLIVNRGVEQFYVGNHGQFDAYVRQALQRLKIEYPQISYAVVLAYLPQPGAEGDFFDTMFPEGIETVPKRFAISWRNNWMLERSEYVVTYITHSWGGAAKYAALAMHRGLKIIGIAEAHGLVKKPRSTNA